MRFAPACASARRTIRRVAFALLFVVAIASGCGRDGSPLTPSAPVDSAPAPVIPAATFRLSGVVTDEKGTAPVPGAHIEVTAGIHAGAGATADAEGRYAIDDLAPGIVALLATADGFADAAISDTIANDTTVNFALISTTSEGPAPVIRWTILGTVHAAGAMSPLSGVWVTATPPYGSGSAATTDASGRYRLADLDAGTVTVRASVAGYVTSSTSVDLDADRTVDLVLQHDPVSNGRNVSGTVVDVLSGGPLADVTVQVVGGSETKTDGGGGFTVAGTAADSQRVRLLSDVTIARDTGIRVAGNAATLTLIPRTFDLHAFDEMFRARGGLHRWVTPPALVVQRRVLAFTNTSDMSYMATANTMTVAEANDLIADLVWALAQLTGGAFTDFASVDIQMAADGDPVAISQPGTIVVARYEGLTAALSTWGYARWAWNDAGEVDAGTIMLDNSFEQAGSPYRRSLRAHELGHTLGCDHVTAGVSVMNMLGRIEPTAFDLNAARIAFLRRPMNMSPDIDPDSTTVNRVRSASRSWAGAP